MAVIIYTAKDNTDVAYLVDAGNKKIRISNKVAHQLVSEDRAVKITASELDEMVKAAKDAEKALVGETVTKAAMEVAIKAEELAAKAA